MPAKRAGRGKHEASTPDRFTQLTPTRRLTLLSAMDSHDAGTTTKKWLNNGRAHEIEAWEIRNEKRSMPHPMYLHGFRVAKDPGTKDTLLV